MQSHPEDLDQLARVGRGVGVVSLAVAAVGAARPQLLASVGGVRSTDPGLSVVVRFAAARQAALGLALLTRTPLDMRRAAGLFLPVTAIDAAAAVAGVRSGALERRAGIVAVTVLVANSLVAVAARRR